MRRTYERGTKARLSFFDRQHFPVNIADSMEEVNVGRKNAGNGTFAALYCPIFRTTGQLPAFSIQSATFTEACGRQRR